jgi:hypothetical protein
LALLTGQRKQELNSSVTSCDKAGEEGGFIDNIAMTGMAWNEGSCFDLTEIA